MFVRMIGTLQGAEAWYGAPALLVGLTFVGALIAAYLGQRWAYKRQRRLIREGKKQELLGRLMGLGYETTELYFAVRCTSIDDMYHKYRTELAGDGVGDDEKEMWARRFETRGPIQVEAAKSTRELLTVLGEISCLCARNREIVANIERACMNIMRFRTSRMAVAWKRFRGRDLEALEQWQREKLEILREHIESTYHESIKLIVDQLLGKES